MTEGPSSAGPLPAVDRVQKWLRTLPGYGHASVESITLLSDGYSHVTCRLTMTNAPLQVAVLRVQPQRGIFEPYDVLREGEVLRRLATTAVPVPQVLASEADPAVLGAPFLLLEWIDAPHIPLPSPETDFASYMAGLSAFATALVAVHTVDWRAAGLGFLGVPASPTDAFVIEVENIARRMNAFGCQREPLLNQALAMLRKPTLTSGRLALCQGDPNIFNYLLRDGQIAAIVDWEQARISDPRSDIGQLGALGHLKGAPFGPARDMAFVQLYEISAGETLVDLELFRALWLFQLGVIYFGMKQLSTIEPWFQWPQIRELLTLSLAEL